MAGASQYLAGMTDASEKLEEFGGWLLLVAIGQWLGVFGALGDFLMELPTYAAQWTDPAVRRGVVGEVVLDAGSGAITSFSTGGRKDVDAALAPMLRPFAQWKGTEITNDAELGTDNFDFMIEGVPTILPNQETANYLVNYHASSDTFDKVDFPQLKINEAMAAELVVELANAPGRIGPRYTRAQIEATFPETHLDDEMKGFRLWDQWVSGKRGRTQ